MATTTKPYTELLHAQLQEPENAIEYLRACLADPDPRVFLLALRDVAEARGGFTEVSRRARVSRESLYKALSRKGNPSIKSLHAVLGAVGLRLSVEKAA